MKNKKPIDSNPSFALTTTQYSVIYDCVPRSIERYKSKALPLDDPREMWAWWAANKNMPAKVRAKGLDAILADLQAVLGGLSEAVGQHPDSDSTPTGPVLPGASGVSAAELNHLPAGAEHELRSLAALARAARGNLIRANAGSDPVARRQALDSYIKLVESLLRYDRSVDPNRRDGEEIVTKAQIQNVLRGVIVWTRRGIENFINESCLRIAECEKPEEVYAIVAESLRGCLSLAVDASLESQTKTPGWVRDALIAGL